MEGEFFFEGEKYISSRRAYELYGYASDYITQLCRASKVPGRRIGKYWFVSEEGLKKHKNKKAKEKKYAIEYSLNTRRKIPVYLEEREIKIIKNLFPQSGSLRIPSKTEIKKDYVESREDPWENAVFSDDDYAPFADHKIVISPSSRVLFQDNTNSNKVKSFQKIQSQIRGLLILSRLEPQFLFLFPAKTVAAFILFFSLTYGGTQLASNTEIGTTLARPIFASVGSLISEKDVYEKNVVENDEAPQKSVFFAESNDIVKKHVPTISVANVRLTTIIHENVESIITNGTEEVSEIITRPIVAVEEKKDVAPEIPPEEIQFIVSEPILSPFEKFAISLYHDMRGALTTVSTRFAAIARSTKDILFTLFFPPKEGVLVQGDVLTPVHPITEEKEIPPLTLEDLARIKAEAILRGSFATLDDVERAIDTALKERPLSIISIPGQDPTLDARFTTLANALRAEIASVADSAEGRTVIVERAVALTNNIDQLNGVVIRNATIDGTLEGLTDAHIPNNITVSGYLPTSGGTIVGSLTVEGAITLSSFSATSTTATSTIAGNFQTSGNLLVGTGTYLLDQATSTFRQGVNLSAVCFAVNGVC